MKKYLHTLNEGSRAVHLSETARTRIRASLAEYAARDRRRVPRGTSDRRREPRLVLSPYLVFLRRPVFAGVLAIMLVFGGTAASAMRALPGDALYALKVDVLEPIRGAFALRELAQAKWQATLADARLNEAEQLAAREVFTEGSQRELTLRFSRAVVSARTLLARAKDADAAIGLAADLDLSLAAHADILSTLASSTGAAPTQKLAAEVVNAGANVAVTAAGSASESAMKKGDEAAAVASVHALRAAQASTVQTKALLEKSRRTLDASTAAEAAEALGAADDALRESRERLSVKAYEEANVFSRRARLLAEETRLLLQVGAGYSPPLSLPIDSPSPLEEVESGLGL